MKRIVSVLTLLTFFIVTPQFVYSQSVDEDFDFARAYQDYVFTQDVYQNALSDYRLARSQYLQAKTLVSQSKARDATVSMLQARDDVVITYLLAIRMRMLEVPGVGESIASGLSVRLDTEIAWFRDHRERIDSAGNLEDLVLDSEEAFQRFEESERVAYETLTTISGGKVDELREDLSSILSATREKVFEIESNGDLDVTLTQRWITETDQKVTRSLDKSIQAVSLSQDFYDSDVKDADDKLELFNEIIASIQESYQLLRDGNNFMKEIIKELTQS